MKTDINRKKIRIVKSDEVNQIIEGVVYEPNVKDTQDDWMSAVDIRKAAYNFMKEARTAGGVDTNHDLVPVEAYVCESYIAKAADPMGHPEGSWVVAIKIEDDEVWQGVLNGDFEGLSMYGQAYREEGLEPNT